MSPVENNSPAQGRPRLIRFKHLPQRPPITLGLVWGMALDHYHAPMWLWGVAGTILVLITAVWIMQLCTSEWIDLGNSKN